eukprot:3390589-Rhodomonas_salina.1
MDMQSNVEAIQGAEERLRLARFFIKDAEHRDALLQEGITEYWQTPANERDPEDLVWHEHQLKANMLFLERYRKKAHNALSVLQMLHDPSFAAGSTFAPFPPPRLVRSHGGGSTSAPFPRGGGYYGGW